MAVPNKSKKQNNYFTQQIKQNGENFINLKDARQLKQDCIRIFRDIAKGKIDPEQEGQFMLVPELLEAAILASEEKYLFHQISRDGISVLIFTNNNNVSDDVRAVHDFHAKATEGYKLILDCFYNLKYTSNINHLYAATNLLRSFRNYI